MKEYRGEWYTNSTNKIPGILKLDIISGEIVLELYTQNYFDGTKIFDAGYPPRFENFILGNTYDGQKITLYHYTGNKNNKGQILVTQQVFHKDFRVIYRPNFIFIGEHFKTEDDIKFKSYSFEYTFLDSWIDNSSGHFFRNRNDNRDVFITNPISPEIIVDVSDETQLQIEHLYESQGELSRELRVKSHYLFTINSKKPQDLNYFFKISGQFQTLLTMGVGYPVEIIDEFVVDETYENGVTIVNTFEKVNHNPKIFNGSMFFSIYDFGPDGIKEIIKNWFLKINEFKPVVDLFIYVVEPFWKKGNTKVFQTHFTNGFLNMCQALESYYNKDNNLDFNSFKEQFNSRKQDIIGKIQKGKDEINLSQTELEFIQQNLRKVEKGKDKQDLKIKVECLLNVASDALKGFIDEEEFDKFSNDLAECRHDLTHINIDDSIELLHTKDLAYLFYHSQILLYALIANKLMGIEQKKINEILAKSDKFRMHYKKSKDEN